MGGRFGLLILALLSGSSPVLLFCSTFSAPVVRCEPAEDVGELLAQLEAASAEDFGPTLSSVFDEFAAASDRHDFEAALRLASGMRVEAARRGPRYLRTRIWASSTLGLAQTRAGQHEAAESTVSEEILALRLELAKLNETLASTGLAVEQAASLRDWREALRLDLVGLRDRRALARLGAGWTGGARADLGAALAGGSRNAALVLGRLELREGHTLRARQLLGSLLREGAGEAWARRGWGLTMLP